MLLPGESCGQRSLVGCYPWGHTESDATEATQQQQQSIAHVCVCASVYAKSLQLCLTLCDPVDYIARQAPLSMGFSRQEYQSGFPCPPPWDLPNPGLPNPRLLGLLHGQTGSLPPVPPGKPVVYHIFFICSSVDGHLSCFCTLATGYCTFFF